MKKPVIFFFSLTLSAGVAADNTETQEHTSTTVLSDAKSTLDKEASLKLTEQDKSLAKQWMLSATDWVKYQQVMSGPRGIWSPGLDPLTALGVSETDPQERRRYAEIWIQMESRRTVLEIAFEVERIAAGKRINGDQLAVNNQSWIRDWEKNRSEVKTQVILFVGSDCHEPCESTFQEVHKSVGDNARLDIFFEQDASAEAIGQWATFMKIPPEVVRNREVTLNFDEGKAQALGVDRDALPQVRVIDLKTGTISETYQ